MDLPAKYCLQTTARFFTPAKARAAYSSCAFDAASSSAAQQPWTSMPFPESRTPLDGDQSTATPIGQWVANIAFTDEDACTAFVTWMSGRGVDSAEMARQIFVEDVLQNRDACFAAECHDPLIELTFYVVWAFIARRRRECRCLAFRGGLLFGMKAEIAKALKAPVFDWRKNCRSR